MTKRIKGLVFVITSNVPNIDRVDNALIHDMRVNANTPGAAGEWVRDIYGEIHDKNKTKRVVIRTKHDPHQLYEMISRDYETRFGAEIQGLAVSLRINPQDAENLFTELDKNPQKYAG